MLKNYWDFISERIAFIDESKVISEDDILTHFEPLTDNRYDIEIYQFLKSDLLDYFRTGEISEHELSSEREYHNCYSVMIKPVKINPLKEDITLDLKSSIQLVESLGLHLLDKDNSLPYVYDQDDVEYHHNIVDIKNVILDEGYIIEWLRLDKYVSGRYDLVGEEHSNRGYTLLDGLDILFVDLNKHKFTIKEIAKKLEWRDYEVDGENIYFDIDMENLRDRVINKNDNYYDMLVDGIDWDHYYDNSYQNNPTTESLFQYHLDNSNARMLVTKIIKNFGGIDVIRQEIDDVEILHALETDVKTDESLVDFFLVGDNYSELDEIGEELLDEVKNLIGDAYTGDLASETLEAVISSFDSKLTDEGIKFHSKREDEDGNWTYRFYYSNDWLDDISFDYGETRGLSLEGIFIEFVDTFGSFYLSPNIPDYGDPDSHSYNADIKQHLSN